MAEILRSVNDPLNLSEVLDGSIKAGIASDTLTVSEQIVHNSILESISDSLNITEDARGPIFLSVGDSLSFAEGDGESINPGTLSDSLILSDVVGTGRPINVGFRDNLRSPLADIDFQNFPNLSELIQPFYPIDPGLDESLSVSLVLTISIIDYLNLTDRAATPIPITLSDTLVLTDSVANTEFEVASDILSLSEVLAYNVINIVSDALVLTDTVVLDGVYPKVLSDTLNLQESASAGIVNLCHAPLGSIPDIIPILDGIRFTYPYVTPTLTLDLRNPNLDNVTQLQQRRINRRSRGGTLQVFRDNAWPATERLILSFSILKDSERFALFNFLDKSLGKEIGYLDHESRQWRGVILTPSAQVSEPSGSGTSVSLEIEGTLV